jgi:Fe-S cluster biosynthesis and repair protein YggX
MMAIMCARCGRGAEQMAQAPLPTPVGKEIHQRVCQQCWQDWLRTQVILINEYRLNLIDPQVRRHLEAEMRAFLQLGGEEPGDAPR